MQSLLHDKITRAKQIASLNACLKTEDKENWDKVIKSIEYLPITYTNEENDYQLLYQKSHGNELLDISVVIYNDLDPCAVWPISISCESSCYEISTFGLPIHPPLFLNSLPKRAKKKLFKKAFRFINKLCQSLDVNEWKSVQGFYGFQNEGLTNWHEEMVKHKAKVNIAHDLYIDMTLDISSIKSNFRKSYKPLINKGLKMWSIGILEGKMNEASEMIWNEFKKLHEKVAGRKTRSDDTWSKQLDTINNNKAFFIYLLNEYDEMVGGGYFTYTLHEGRYDVAAYERALFNLPLGHVIQFKAIEKFKQIGVKWYKIGKRPYYSDMTIPSDKEVAIGEFKQGFASHLFPEYIYINTRDSI